MAPEFKVSLEGIDIETIQEKLLKVKALMENGATEGERTAAATLLERHLRKYGLTLEDLRTAEPAKIYWFKFLAKEERRIIFQLYCRVTGVHGEFSYHRNYRNTMIVGLAMTRAQYLELSELVPLFLRQYRKEIEKVKEAAISAFMGKHDLFGHSTDGSTRKVSEAEWAQIRAMMANMDKIQLPLKKLTK